MKDIIKTMSGWEDSDADSFMDYCNPGDFVDDDIVDYFLNVVPPVTFEAGFVQCGEAISHKPDPDKEGRYRATYATFVQEGDGWKFCGECFAGQTESRREKLKDGEVE